MLGNGPVQFEKGVTKKGHETIMVPRRYPTSFGGGSQKPGRETVSHIPLSHAPLPFPTRTGKPRNGLADVGCLCSSLLKKASYAFSCWMSEQVFSTSVRKDVREKLCLLKMGIVERV
jgi:hypothetical protein